MLGESVKQGALRAVAWFFEQLTDFFAFFLDKHGRGCQKCGWPLSAAHNHSRCLGWGAGELLWQLKSLLATRVPPTGICELLFFASPPLLIKKKGKETSSHSEQCATAPSVP